MSDEELRTVEREAAAGDAEAAKNLPAMRCRAGQCCAAHAPPALRIEITEAACVVYSGPISPPPKGVVQLKIRGGTQEAIEGVIADIANRLHIELPDLDEEDAGGDPPALVAMRGAVEMLQDHPPVYTRGPDRPHSGEQDCSACGWPITGTKGHDVGKHEDYVSPSYSSNAGKKCPYLQTLAALAVAIADYNR